MHSVFLIPAIAGLLLPVFVPSKWRVAERRISLLGAIVAIVSAFFIAFPPDWKTGLQIALLAVVIAVLNAYFRTPYIKIRGKIYAFRAIDSRPDPDPKARGRR
jgi:hypothetical protein